MRRPAGTAARLRYPGPEEYIRAVQDPRSAFRDAALRRATFAVDPVLHVPMPASGTSAVVFRAEVDGRERALRFFTRDAADPARYIGLGPALASGELAAAVVEPRWRDEAIRVGGRRWPMVDMEWVEGRTLDVYVAHLAERGDARSLTALAVEWRSLIATMQREQFAHGDLQHGNVLIDTSGALRLVDLDGSWSADVAGRPAPSELGHRNYQHSTRRWGRWMDTFPGLVVYTALVCLAKDPRLWEPSTTDDRILFDAEDLAPPFATDTWRALDRLSDPDVERMLAVLRDCCRPDWTASTSLEDLITRPGTASGAAAARSRAAPASRTGSSARWWESADPDSAARPLPPPPPTTASIPKPGAPRPDPAAASTSGHPLDPAWFRHTARPDPEVPASGDGSFPRLVKILAAVAVAWLVVIAIVLAAVTGVGDDGIEGRYTLTGSQTTCEGMSDCPETQSVSVDLTVSDCDADGCTATSSWWDEPMRFLYRPGQEWRVTGRSTSRVSCDGVANPAAIALVVSASAASTGQVEGTLTASTPATACTASWQSWRLTGTSD